MRKVLSAIKPSGFTTPEALLAAGIMGVIVTALVGALIYGVQSTATAGSRDRAANLAMEGIEAVRSIRDENYDSLSAGTYGLALAGSEWTFSGTSDTTGIYGRSITLTSAGANMFEVASTVTWQQTAQRNGTITYTTYLSNWNAPDTTPPAAVTDLATSSITTSSIGLSWTAPGDDDDHGIATSYDVRYSTSMITESNWSSATQATGEPTPSAAGSAESMTVPGLSSATIYYFAIKTSDEVPNESSLSNVPDARTDSLYQSEDFIVDVSGAVIDVDNDKSITGITFENIGTADIVIEQMTISWSGTADSTKIHKITVDGIVRWVFIGGSNPATIDIDDVTLSPGVGLVPLNSLEFNKEISGATLDIEFHLSDGSSISVSFSPATVLDSTPPAAVADLAATLETLSSVRLTWTAPGDDGNTGTATVYDIRYRPSSLTSGNWQSATQVVGEPVPSVAGSSESMVITDLLPNTDYYFGIISRDDAGGDSELSNVSNILLVDDTTPAAVTDLTASNESLTSIALSWTAPGADGNTGTASSYDVRYSTSNITEENWDLATQANNEPTPSVAGSSESMTVTGLSQNTTYYFAIKTSNAISNTSSIAGISNLEAATIAQADALNIDVSSAGLDPGNNTHVTGITIENTESENIILGSMTVSWTGALGGTKINEILLNSNSVWLGSASSGSSVDITDSALISGAGSYSINYLDFNKDMTGTELEITFTMSDGSTKTVTGINP